MPICRETLPTMPSTVRPLLLLALLTAFAPAWIGATTAAEDRPAPPPPLLSPEEVEQAFELVERISPELVEGMRKRYETEPRKVEEAILKQFPRFKRFLNMRRWDPKRFDLQVEEMRLAHKTSQLAAAYQKAQADGSEPQAESLHEQLRTCVTDLVGVRDAIREHELKRLENRLARLKSELEERTGQREQLVTDYMDKLLSEGKEESPEAKPTEPAPEAKDASQKSGGGADAKDAPEAGEENAAEDAAKDAGEP